MFANIILGLTSLLIFLLGLLVYLNNSKRRANQVFFGFTISVVFWTITNLLTNLASDPQWALIWARATIVGAALLVYFFLIFSFYFPKIRGISFVNMILLGIPALVFIILSPTSLNISSATANGQSVTTGSLYILMAVYLPIYLIWSFMNFIRSYRHSQGQEKQQLKYVFAAIILSFGPGFILNAVGPIIGVPQLASIGPLFVLFFVAIISYAMLRHRLLDIRSIVARSVTYVLTIGLIGGVYGFLAFGLANVFLQNTSQLFQQSVYTILAIVLAFLFQPIRRLFEKISNAIFYRGKYDAQQLINEIGRILAGEIQLDQLSHKVIRELAKQMKINSVDIVVLSEKSVHFQTRVFSSEQHNVIVSDLKKLGRLAVVADEITGGEKKEIMKKYGYSVSLALRTSEEFLGYLLLGEKKSGDIYSTEDLRTLKIIANELSVGLQNAKAFAEIQAFNVTLQQKVNQATKSLRHANDQLKELDKAKDEFISMASHQLRTPLTTVKGYVSMLDEGDFGKISKAQREPIEQVLDGSNRMARLIDDLLNVSRMEAGRFFIDATDIDLNKIVPQEVDQLQSLAKSKKVELVYKAPAKPIPTMHLDENKTRQVIMNLADNAVHYSQPPKGGGKVEVRLERDGDDIVYAVRDNGIGVPKDQQDRLFTKMFRARNAQELRPDGTGLGLYLVKRVIEDQGGKIVFESEPGKGSMFGFRMPIHNKVVVDKKAQKALAEAHKND